MLEVCVGERPKGLSRGTLEEFNAVFLKMFHYFGDHERVVTVWNGNHEEDPLSNFGSLTVAAVRRWLEYYQLVNVEKQTEDDTADNKNELLKKHGWSLAYDEKWNKWCLKSWRGYDTFFDHEPSIEEVKEVGCGRRNLTIIRPTKRGCQAYEDGLIIQVDWGSPIEVGLGKPYHAGASSVYQAANLVWDKAKISQSRRDKWSFELKEYYIGNLLGKKADEALNMMQSWASAKAWEWNSNHKIRRGIKAACYALPSSQRRLF